MIPLRPSFIDFGQKWPKNIIIHHTFELGLDSGELSLSKDKYQINALNRRFYQKFKQYTPYHFILDKAGNDFQVVVGRPLLTKVDFVDIPDKYSEDIHIGIIDNFHESIPSNRLYLVLSFRLLVPLMRLFNIDEDGILLHKDISEDKDHDCPGDFFNIARLRSTLRSQIRRRTVIRR